MSNPTSDKPVGSPVGGLGVMLVTISEHHTADKMYPHTLHPVDSIQVVES